MSANARQIYKEGTLYKRGKVNKQWKERHFVVANKFVHYFAGGKGTPSGQISVPNISGIGQVGEMEPEAFSVIVPGRQYILKGINLSESIEWRDAFIEACRANGKEFS